MSGHIGLSHELSQYVTGHSRESAVAKRLREASAKHPLAQMLTTADEVHFLAMMVRITGAKRIIEIGTFTGYSALAMAEALPEGGKLIACDMSSDFTSIGLPYWREAGVDNRIDLRIAPAMDTLTELLESDAGSFDMIFIDADKTGYDAYYEAGLKLVRSGGIILFDNMLWSGAVADAKNQEDDTKALRALNAKIAKDTRVDATLLTLADGVMLVRKW